MHHGYMHHGYIRHRYMHHGCIIDTSTFLGLSGFPLSNATHGLSAGRAWRTKSRSTNYWPHLQAMQVTQAAPTFCNSLCKLRHYHSNSGQQYKCNKQTNNAEEVTRKTWQCIMGEGWNFKYCNVSRAKNTKKGTNNAEALSGALYVLIKAHSWKWWLW